MNQCQETVRLVCEVGESLLARMAKVPLNVRRKEGNHQNLVTDFDVWVQSQLQEGLAQIVPEAHFFAEEQHNENSPGLTWYVDPIDGTTNFISTRCNFAICVGLYDGHTPRFGVVYDVARDVCYHAEAGGPAYANDRLLEKRQPVALSDALIDCSLTTVNALSRRAGVPLYRISCAARGHRALGSASLAMCHIAEGSLDAYVSHRLYPWDYAASGVILAAAGGVYGSLYEDPLFTTEKAAVLCAGDKNLAARLRPFFEGQSDIQSLLD